ncbi:MAG: putative sulfate exporter family transporter [Bacteroidaceae bacterium]|nr:putative sulfate exporter family transporter [Bacteroidaceae bacterium]
MEKLRAFVAPFNKILFLVCMHITLLPFITPTIALFMGLAYALILTNPIPKMAKKTSKYLLQVAVVCLGFGMNLHTSLASGKEGMIFTIVSVTAVMLIGFIVGKLLKVDSKISYLLSSGTAICGGSAIAAVAPIVKANDNQMSVALGTVFILNAIALFIFPPIGHWLGMTQEQFGEWAAIAIHDTSSVVGAGEAYDRAYFPDSEGIALQIATLIKCTRALWIIPLALITTLIFREKNSKISIPWFILFFILAMIANTYIAIPQNITSSIVWFAKKGMCMTLFLIGSGLSLDTLRAVGIKPLIQGVLLWITIALLSLATIMWL